MSFSRLLRFSDPSSIALLGVMLMASSTFIYYFYSKASSSNSFEPKKEESSSNSSETKKEESSSNSSEPKKEESSSNSSEPKKEESSSNSSEPKIMASTSTSSIQSSFQYDVFISFRGEDTRKTFVGHLYQALEDKGIATFKDDKRMKQGKTIDNQLIQAIKDSRFFIIVFSKNYASSSWCLDELVEIMECQKTGDQTAYPIFLDVEPTQVRYQSGEFGEAFKENKKKDAAGKWIEALKGASNLVGRELQATANGNEAEFIKKIVGEISLELRSINFDFDEKLVGMETRVKDVVSYLEIGIDDVRIIGIKGMGGAGKTTTARAVFDHMSIDFEAKSFVENVRDVSNASMFGLKYLQERVLSDVLNEHVTVKGVIDGKNMMKRRMCGQKVLLVLDDVDHIEQLKALAGEPEWFKPGSRILITTRDEQVLVAHRVNMIRDIVLLSKQEAISLFSRYAFGRENPLEGYEGLSGKVVHYADGLPLTLEVLGSFLCGKDKDEWEDAIERLKNIPLKETMEKLELSYINLEDDYKEIFLDIVCMLKGKRKTDAISILESCGFHARNGLKVLEQRSLITISKDEVLGMHDHIEEMGKNIVRREHPDEPNKHSRLWINEEIEDIFANDKGTEATRCLKLTTSRRNSRIVMKGLVKMKKLRYLEVNFPYYDVFMSFKGGDTRKNFVDHLYHALKDKGIFIYGDDEKIWKGKLISDDLFEAIETSEFYIIVFSERYASSSWCLEELVKIMEMTGRTAYPVFYDVDPTDVRYQRGAVGEAFAEHEKKEAAGKLRDALKKAADLAGWELNTHDGHEDKLIEKIVEDISPKLRPIDSGVVGHEMVLEKLKFVSLSSSNLTTFDFGMTPNLETLFLYNSRNLEELCMPVTCQKLKHLSISHSKLRTFDLGLTPNLETLSLKKSYYLEELCMPVTCQKLKHLDISSSKLRTFDLGLTPNLETLSLEKCADFVELHVFVACPNLKFLNLTFVNQG